MYRVRENQTLSNCLKRIPHKRKSDVVQTEFLHFLFCHIRVRERFWRLQKNAENADEDGAIDEKVIQVQFYYRYEKFMRIFKKFRSMEMFFVDGFLHIKMTTTPFSIMQRLCHGEWRGGHYLSNHLIPWEHPLWNISGKLGKW